MFHNKCFRPCNINEVHNYVYLVINFVEINTIRSIIQNPYYQKLADLYLDNNSISTVKELEGSEWFTSFRVLSLKGNLLKQIPVYAFDKALQSNVNIMQVFLGHNPWRCDCHFIPRFQSLLLKYKRIIRDFADVRCSNSDDNSLSLVQAYFDYLCKRLESILGKNLRYGSPGPYLTR